MGLEVLLVILMISMLVIFIVVVILIILSNAKRIKSFMILKSGQILIKKRLIKDNSFDYDKGKYNIKHTARMFAKNFPFGSIPAYVHIEGIPEPVDPKNTNAKEIKIDAKNYKELLKAKLFSDLFAKPVSTMDIVIIVLCVLAILAGIASFIATQQVGKAVAEHTDMLQAISDALFIGVK